MANDYRISQFAIDDFILLLAYDKQLYDSVSEFSEVPHSLALKKLREITELMRENGVPIRHTKRLMHVFRAVTGFRAAPATFAERLVKEGVKVLGQARIREIFLPLVEALDEASRLLVVKPPSSATP